MQAAPSPGWMGRAAGAGDQTGASWDGKVNQKAGKRAGCPPHVWREPSCVRYRQMRASPLCQQWLPTGWLSVMRGADALGPAVPPPPRLAPVLGLELLRHAGPAAASLRGQQVRMASRRQAQVLLPYAGADAVAAAGVAAESRSGMAGTVFCCWPWPVSRGGLPCRRCRSR